MKWLIITSILLACLNIDDWWYWPQAGGDRVSQTLIIYIVRFINAILSTYMAVISCLVDYQAWFTEYFLCDTIEARLIATRTHYVRGTEPQARPWNLDWNRTKRLQISQHDQWWVLQGPNQVITLNTTLTDLKWPRVINSLCWGGPTHRLLVTKRENESE